MELKASTTLILSCELEQNGVATFFVEQPGVEVGRHMTRFVGFQALQDKNRSLYHRIKKLISERTTQRQHFIEIFKDDDGCDFVEMLLGTHFASSQTFLEDIFSKSLTAAEKEGIIPVVEIDPCLSFIPWEIIPFKGSDDEKSSLLGEHFVFVSDLLQKEKMESLYSLSPESKPRKETLRVRAAGDSKAPFSMEEQSILNSLPKPIFEETMTAKAINSATDEIDFFHFFSNFKYDVFHFFGHCGYEKLSESTSQFELSFSDNWKLKFIDFKRARARFNASAIGFLNVCSSLPASPHSGVSPADYFISEQGIQFLLASLFPVRGSEASSFAKIFYEEVLPSVTRGNSAQYAVALMKSRRLATKSGDFSPLFYRPVGDVTIELMGRDKIRKRLYG